MGESAPVTRQCARATAAVCAGDLAFRTIDPPLGTGSRRVVHAISAGSTRVLGGYYTGVRRVLHGRPSGTTRAPCAVEFPNLRSGFGCSSGRHGLPCAVDLLPCAEDLGTLRSGFGTLRRGFGYPAQRIWYPAQRICDPAQRFWEAGLRARFAVNISQDSVYHPAAHAGSSAIWPPDRPQRDPRGLRFVACPRICPWSIGNASA